MTSRKNNPNPQGKGLVPVLQDWHALRATTSMHKNAAAFLRDYCISSLVLGAHFKFKPVVGNIYYLYAGESQWALSLIGPHEWGEGMPGEFLAPCTLKPDMTWTFEGDDLQDAPALTKLQIFIEGFVHAIQGQESIADELPYYVAKLPYYQRMLATALSSSLAQSNFNAQEVKQLAQSGRALLGIAPKDTSGDPAD